MHSAVGSHDERHAQGVVEIVAPDIDALVRFYQPLGFGVERQVPGFAVLAGHGIRLFLAEYADAPTAARWTNLRIIVDDVDALWRRVVGLGIQPSSPLRDRSYGLRDFCISDPAGFEIRFAQPL